MGLFSTVEKNHIILFTYTKGQKEKQEGLGGEAADEEKGEEVRRKERKIIGSRIAAAKSPCASRPSGTSCPG